jgi:hypothetical protein
MLPVLASDAWVQCRKSGVDAQLRNGDKILKDDAVAAVSKADMCQLENVGLLHDSPG